MRHSSGRRHAFGRVIAALVAGILIGAVLAVLLMPKGWFAGFPREARSAASSSNSSVSAKAAKAGGAAGDVSGSDGSGNGQPTGVPTLYIHGYNGGRVTSDSMIAYAAKHDGATKVLTATVSAKGEVGFTGTWPRKARCPLVQVLFEDNKNGDYNTTTEWMHNLIVALQQRYHITRYNTVAHSMGNVVVMYYEERYGSDAKLPKLVRQVNIAGNFNGILGDDDAPNKNSFLPDGSPKYQDKDYRALLAGRGGFPSGVDVLNIYGNLDDGTNGDTSVSTVSARSLKPLLGGKAASYQEIEVHGAMAQHSQLHENAQVTAAVDAFLWKH